MAADEEFTAEEEADQGGPQKGGPVGKNTEYEPVFLGGPHPLPQTDAELTPEEPKLSTDVPTSQDEASDMPQSGLYEERPVHSTTFSGEKPVDEKPPIDLTTSDATELPTAPVESVMQQEGGDPDLTPLLSEAPVISSGGEQTEEEASEHPSYETFISPTGKPVTDV